MGGEKIEVANVYPTILRVGVAFCSEVSMEMKEERRERESWGAMFVVELVPS